MLGRRLIGAVVIALIVMAARPVRADVAYSVDIKTVGVKDKALSGALDNASQLVALKDRPPPSAASLRRRAEDDLSRLRDVMHAAGYWDALVAFTADTNVAPARVTVTVTPGLLFHLKSVAFVLPSGAPATLPSHEGPAALGLTLGGPALSAPVEGGDARIVALFGQNGQPFAQVTDRRVVVDVASKTMSVTYTIEPGPHATFGATTIDGLRGVHRDFVTRRIAWTEGAPYDERQVEATRSDLTRSGLFSGVEVRHAEAPAPDGSVAMTIDLIEGPPHSVGAGAGYNTNIGLGARAFWEDRNLFGEGEDLKLTAGAAQKQLGVAANFRRPDFLMRKQDLIVNAELLHQTTDAYISRREDAYAGVEELMFPPYTFGGGVALERATLTELARDENYFLIGAPLYVRRDTTDDILNPTRGTRTTFTITPYHGLSSRSLDFVTSRLDERSYFSLTDDNRFVLAGYGAIGSVEGPNLDDLPADKRLYAGGSGSVRGYDYQRAGPLDQYLIPVGGRSSLELGTELRYRITDTVGLVPFVDAGNVYPSNYPDNLSLFYGAGLGLRYYTLIGPLRLDLAFPLEKRPSDRPFQIYLSLGQAF